MSKTDHLKERVGDFLISMPTRWMYLQEKTRLVSEADDTPVELQRGYIQKLGVILDIERDELKKDYVYVTCGYCDEKEQEIKKFRFPTHFLFYWNGKVFQNLHYKAAYVSEAYYLSQFPE